MKTSLPLAVAVAAMLGSSAAVPAFAATPSARPSPSPTSTAGRLEDIKKRGDQEIDARLKTLAELSDKVAGAKGLSDTDRAALQGTLSSDKAALRALRAKLDAETTAEAAIADVKQITESYRVYAVVDEQVRLAIADDTLISACASKLPKVEQELSAAVARSGSADARARLADFQSQVQTACAAASAAHSEIVGLQASGFPGNRSAIQDARSKLEAARSAFHKASADAHAIIADLQSETKASPSPTAGS